MRIAEFLEYAVTKQSTALNSAFGSREMYQADDIDVTYRAQLPGGVYIWLPGGPTSGQRAPAKALHQCLASTRCFEGCGGTAWRDVIDSLLVISTIPNVSDLLRELQSLLLSKDYANLSGRVIIAYIGRA